jgi:two-component system chemotaxis response regulator CheB
MTRPQRGAPTRVLIVDDSALMRQMLADLLAHENDIEVIGTAADPLIAREMIKRLNPDVLTLDVEMPRMDGLEFLERLMTLRPMPVVMVSTLTASGTETTLRALELGAVDFIAKPQMVTAEGMRRAAAELAAKLRAAAQAKVRPAAARPTPRPAAGGGYARPGSIIAIGASTGGVEALREIVGSLPPDCPAVLITQHMPAAYTRSFAARLNGLAAVAVREASEGAPVLDGHVYIAPGDEHLRLARAGAGFVCRLGSEPLISGHRPSVDALFHSVAEAAGAAAIGVILTGMGRDGAQGLLRMREAGAMTFGEDASSCVVYGMPKAAQALGAVAMELPLSRIVPEVLRHCRGTVRA